MSTEEKISHYVDLWEQKRISKPKSCQVCHQSGRLLWHGHYKRSLITMTQKYHLTIKRVFCSLCRHTFALLPDSIVKFHRYAKEVIRSAICWLKSRTYEAVTELIANKAPKPGMHNIAALTLYFWRRKFG